MKTENNNPLSANTFRHWLIMLTLALLAACTSDSSNPWSAEDVCPESDRGYFTDHRDQREYKYTTIGDQVWMAENLDYKNDTYYCADKYIENYCAIYGGLYNFPEWDSIQTICPEGWHVPSKAEWEELIETMGGKKAINKGVLRTREGWFQDTGKGKFVADTSGTDLCGFTALPGGGGYDYWRFDKEEALWWSTTLTEWLLVETYYMSYSWNYFHPNGQNNLGKYSIRCVKDK